MIEGAEPITINILWTIASMFDPFDAIFGEHAAPETDDDGNGIPDHLGTLNNPHSDFCK